MPDVFLGQKNKDRDRRFDDANMDGEAKAIPDQPISEETPISLSKMQRIKNKVHRMHLFTAFAENPANVRFETQEDDEKILVFMRKSNFMNLPWIIIAIFLFFVPYILYLLHNQFTQITPPVQFILVLVPFYYIVVIIYAFVHFLTWWYNAALITNKRVIDIDFHQLVMKEVDETKLALVQDVSYRQDGVFENIFDFGYVLIQTAGTIDNFEFFGLPQPDRVVQIVQQLIGGRRLYEP